jgi:hypothetical protein
VRPRFLAALVVAGAAILLLHRLVQRELAPDPAPPPALGRPGEAESATPPAAALVSPHAEPPSHDEALALPPDPAAEGAAPAEVPLSSVAHRVLTSWGGASGTPGPRELQLLVEPGLGTHELERLLRDAVSTCAAADVLTIRIYDSEHAARYDRHSDGGALAERHLVASMSRHRRLGVESLRVRGVELDP